MASMVRVRACLFLIATVLQGMALAFLAPMAVAFLYGETVWPWMLSLAVAALPGTILRWLMRESHEIGTREVFYVVGISWLTIVSIGTLPYLFFGALTPVDAFFESMSGFTTTGATVLTDIESQPRSLLFWRSLSQWLGGMGIIVLAVAILPRLAVGGRQLMEAELPGVRVERLTPHIRDTARRLWTIYAGLTVLEGASLLVVGLSPFDALIHPLTTISLAGFSPYQQSVGVLPPAAQWIMMVFIAMSGINYVLLYHVLRGGPKQLGRDEEFRFYLFLIAMAALLLGANVWNHYQSIEEVARHSLFQTLSIITGTGYASTDFNQWHTTPQVIILVLMFIGASVGSPTGSVKILRWLIVLKMIAREVRQIIHPHAVIPIRLGARVVSEEALRGVTTFTLLFLLLFVAGTILLLLNVTWQGGIDGKPLGVLEAMSAVAATLGNVGPGLGAFGPMESYASLPAPSKLMLAMLMWVGRLEIFPVMVLLTRSYWRRE